VDGSGLKGITLEEISALPEWKSLGSRTCQILTAALPARSLIGAVHQMFPEMSLAMKRDLCVGLLKEPRVRIIVDLFATAIVVPPDVLEPVAVPAPPVDESAIGFDAGTFDAVAGAK